jgi:hypothetical protein
MFPHPSVHIDVGLGSVPAKFEMLFGALVAVALVLFLVILAAPPWTFSWVDVAFWAALGGVAACRYALLRARSATEPFGGFLVVLAALALPLWLIAQAFAAR